MKKRRMLMDWERTAIIEAYKAGEKVTAIQAEFGYASVSYATRLARRAGVPLRGPDRGAQPSNKRQAYLRRQQLVALRQQNLHR